MARHTLRRPDELPQRVEAASRQSGISLNQLIVSTLRGAKENGRLQDQDSDPRLEQIKRLRLILGNLAEPTDQDEQRPEVQNELDLPIEEFRRSFPVLDPPLSVPIAQDREDRL